MNFTKPNRAAIRYTNSQWLREDATEASVGGVPVPKIGQKNALPREDGTEPLVGRVPVPRTGRNTGVRPVCGRLGDALARGVGTEGIVGRVTVARAWRNAGVRPV